MDGLATTKYVDEAIKAIPGADLTGVATTEYVDKAVENIELTPGPKGEPGATPVKGVDYFTAEDQAAMVAAVVAALPVYGGDVE